jgi:hypothetical protein
VSELFNLEGAEDEMMPVADALRSLEWAMKQSARYRKERDTYRMLFDKLDAAMRAYVAEVAPLLARSPWASAKEANEAKGREHVARAKAYNVSGLSAAKIGDLMGREDATGVAYPERTVRRWLADNRG